MAEKNRKIISGQDNRMIINNHDAIPLGLNKMVMSDKEDPTKQTAYYSLKDQKRKTWFVIDLETGDNWNPVEDPEVERLERLRNEQPPGSLEYQDYQSQLEELYKQHPAFIRKQD